MQITTKGYNAVEIIRVLVSWETCTLQKAKLIHVLLKFLGERTKKSHALESQFLNLLTIPDMRVVGSGKMNLE